MNTCGIYLYSKRLDKFLACHATHAAWNQWSIPKGLQNTKESLLDTATRELKEETGIELGRLNILQVHQLPTMKYQKQDKVLESFLIVTDTDLSHHPFICRSLTDKMVPEIDDWKWISMNQRSMLHESQQKNFMFIDIYLSR